jgi:pyruvate/2-oxoglutarate dehydrogenase complex dihydrolipoamide dehydrogenase (E3) component
VSGRVNLPRDGRLRIATGLWMIGDPAGPELHTHQGHYQGEMAVQMALGDNVRPDYRALPRATYTDPEAAFVGLSLEQARAEGYDAFEVVSDFPKTAKGYSVEAKIGHVTVVVDRKSRTVIGVAIAAPDASAAVHEGVLAIKARVPIEVLADTIHAFPSTSRVFNALFNEAAHKLADEERSKSDEGRMEAEPEAVGRTT